MHPPSGQHPVEYLFSRLKDLDYPDGLVPTPEMIHGTAFFPGGAGVWREMPGGCLPAMPCGKVMVLGQDFHTLKNYRKSFAVGHELDTPTWEKGLRPLLKRGSIPPTDCFFTNAYMGLRTDACSTGPSPGTKRVNRRFRQQCQSFLIEDQIAVQQPRLLLLLGLEVVRFVAPLSRDLTTWRKARSWRNLDAAGPIRHGVRLGDCAARITVVALLHPSLRDPNLAKDPELRSWNGRTGDDAELAMLREAATVLS